MKKFKRQPYLVSLGPFFKARSQLFFFFFLIDYLLIYFGCAGSSVAVRACLEFQ